MVRSMTAFTRQETVGEIGELALEIRTVNHRFLDISLRLPEEVRAVEPALREQVASRLNRGKVEITIRHQLPEASSGELTINQPLAEQLADVSHQVDKMLYNPAPVSAFDVLRWPGILQSQAVDSEQLKAEISRLLNSGLEDLNAGREREGEKLKQVIEQRLDGIEEVIERVTKVLPEIMQSWRDKLIARIQEAKLELDEERLEQEIVYLANKTDVEEELDRLKMHVAEVRRVLEQDKPMGRRLDFLMQELNREANTLGSKSVHAETTRASVDLKVYIEQMREQIQNIE